MSDSDSIIAFTNVRQTQIHFDILPEPAPPTLDLAFTLQSASAVNSAGRKQCK